MEINENYDEFYDAILSLESREACRYFFEDLLTPKELASLAQRVRAAKLLMKGNTYEKIIAETNISSATLSRVSKCVQYGKGYKNILKQ